MTTSEQRQQEIKSQIAVHERAINALKHEETQIRDAAMATRREAGKNDPTSGFYEGYTKDAWGYPLDPLMND